MEQERAGRYQNKIITIPNILSFFRLCLIPLIVWLYCVKKDYPLFAAVTSLLVIRRSGTVLGAVWHGKAATVLLYAMMLVHLLWLNIPAAASNVLIGACTACAVSIRVRSYLDLMPAGSFA